MKTIKSGVIRLVNRASKNATMPTMTSPINNFVVELQRGEFVRYFSMPSLQGSSILPLVSFKTKHPASFFLAGGSLLGASNHPKMGRMYTRENSRPPTRKTQRTYTKTGKRQR